MGNHVVCTSREQEGETPRDSVRGPTCSLTCRGGHSGGAHL